MQFKFLKIILIAVVIAVFSVSFVEAQHGRRSVQSKTFVTTAYEELTATSTNVITITSGLISTTTPRTQRAYIKVTGQGIRWLCSGGTPSTSLGNPALVGEWFQLVGLADIQNFKFVNDDDTGTSTCHVNLQVQGVMTQ